MYIKFRKKWTVDPKFFRDTPFIKSAESKVTGFECQHKFCYPFLLINNSPQNNFETSKTSLSYALFDPYGRCGLWPFWACYYWPHFKNMKVKKSNRLIQKYANEAQIMLVLVYLPRLEVTVSRY